MKRITNKILLVILGTLIVVAMSFFLQSCSNSNKEERLEKETIMHLILAPDSLLSSTEIQSKYKIGKAIFDNSKVIDNKLVLDLDEKSLDELGFSSDYYNDVLMDIEDFNRSCDSLNIDVFTILEESRQRFNNLAKEK